MISNIKKVAFPREHGSWGFFLEPILLSLLVGYSLNGLLLVLSSFVIFLAHQPIRVLLNKKNPKKIKSIAVITFVFYAFISLLLLSIVILEIEFEILGLFLISVLMMFGYLLLELKNLGRNLFAEFIAPIAITFIALNVVLLNNWTFTKIIFFGIVLLSRAIPTLLYIHTKVEIIKGKNISSLLLRVSEFIFLALIIFFALNNSVPYLSILAIAILIFRSVVGLLPKNKNEKTKEMGMKEFGFGILFVIINAIGYLFNY